MENEVKNTETKNSNFTSKGKFAKGNKASACRKNRLSVEMLFKAQRNWEKKHKRPWLDMLFEQSEKEPAIAVALLKKMIPDKHELGGNDGKPIEVRFV